MKKAFILGLVAIALASGFTSCAPKTQGASCPAYNSYPPSSR